MILCLHIAGAKAILFRRSYPELRQEILPRMKLYLQGIATWKGDEFAFFFPNGSVFRLGYLESEDDVLRYQGPEYQAILYDELTHFLKYTYTYMRTRCRAAGAVKAQMDAKGWIPRMMAATNPGGPGHGWVKKMFVDPAHSRPRDEMFLGGVEDDEPDDHKRVLAYIPAKATDNPFLDQETYRRQLSSVGDPLLIRALRDGDWDILKGVRFSQFRYSVHVIDTWPEGLLNYPLAVAVDYGQQAPFCALWGALLPDGTIVIYRELYRVGLTASEQAALMRASELPIERLDRRYMPVALDPSTWIRSSENTVKPVDPDVPPMGSIAWYFREQFGTAVVKARNDRVSGWQLIDEHLRVREDGHPRLLIVGPACPNLLRTLPAMVRSKNHPEDVATTPKQEDHAPDTARYLVQQFVGRATEHHEVDMLQIATRILTERDLDRRYDTISGESERPGRRWDATRDLDLPVRSTRRPSVGTGYTSD